MVKTKKAQIGAFLFLIGVIIIIVAMTGTVITELNLISYKEKHCIQQGYKFYDIGKNKCYNLIPHESNVGDERIYSGEINYFEVRLK